MTGWWLVLLVTTLVAAWIEIVIFTAVWLNGRGMTLKSWWFVWFGYGWLQEPQERRLTKSWIRSVYWPYLHGVGLSLRIGNHAIRIGVCRTFKRRLRRLYRRYGGTDQWEQAFAGELELIGGTLSEEAYEQVRR